MSTALNILLIEDSPADAELLALRLEKAGFAPAITRVMTAEEMRAALAKDDWDLVLADYQLPRFSGLEAIRLLRESGRDLPIIVVSGAVGEEAAVAAMKAGAHDFVRKDNMARLGPAIERELREARERAGRREAEERYRQIVDLANEGITTVDADRHFTFVNRQFGEMLGYAPEELVGRASLDLVAPEDVPHGIALSEQSKAGAPVLDELTLRRRDGTTLPVLVASQPFLRPDGSYGGAVTMVLDISARRQAEAEARRQTERVQLLAELSHAFAAATTDLPLLLDLVVRRLGEVVGDMVSLRLAVAGAENFETAAIYHADPALAELSRQFFNVEAQGLEEGLTGRVLTEGRPFMGAWDTPEEAAAQATPRYHDLIVRTRTTSVLMLPLRARGRNVGVMTISRSGGKARAFTEDDLGLAQDVADRAALALDNALLYTHLEERVAARTAELAATNEALEAQKQELQDAYGQLQELDRLKNNFVNSVSHELRTPLTSILGYAEFLEDEIGGLLTPDQHKFVTQIQAGTRRLQRLVDDLLDFARMDAGTFTLRIEAGDFCAKADEIAASVRPMVGDAQLTLEVSCEGPLVLPMDGVRIGQVLINLITNAVKFTPAGGQIGVRVTTSGDRIRCEVTDSGVGIAAEDVPRLFQRFSQLHGGRAGGTGLGLSICKALIEAHGGEIGVVSQPGQGSTFWFTLPTHRGLP